MVVGALEEAAMNKRTAPAPVSDEEICALLERYQCPVPFHEVRALFLGSIATPVMSVSPIKTVQNLWGGDLPVFDSVDEANELFGALVMGLWNHLTAHQQRNSPFRLSRVATDPTDAGIAALASIRCQELDGFVEGLFGGEKVIDLPERALRGLGNLAEMRATFVRARDTVLNNATTGTGPDMQTTLRHLGAIARNAELEIHAIVLSCTRARRQRLATFPTTKPTLH